MYAAFISKGRFLFFSFFIFFFTIQLIQYNKASACSGPACKNIDYFLFSIVHIHLTFTTLWTNSAHDKLTIFFLNFPRKQKFNANWRQFA